MLKDSFYSDFNSLPEDLKQQVKSLVESMSKNLPKAKRLKPRKFGLLKGKIRLSKDFDAPLEDFAEYQ
jgi:hypothetical protein